MRQKHLFGSARQRGPLMQKSSDLGSFAAYAANTILLRKLNKRWKLFRGEDGWFAQGRNGQVWEYGVRQLGFTVTTARMIEIVREAGFKLTQRGDQEANFACPWDDQTVGRLTTLLRLRIRRSDSGGFLSREPSN